MPEVLSALEDLRWLGKGSKQENPQRQLASEAIAARSLWRARQVDVDRADRAVARGVTRGHDVSDPAGEEAESVHAGQHASMYVRCTSIDAMDDDHHSGLLSRHARKGIGGSNPRHTPEAQVRWAASRAPGGGVPAATGRPGRERPVRPAAGGPTPASEESRAEHDGRRAQVRASELLRGPTRGSYSGKWSEKYPRNFPGPFYSTTDNLNSLAACGASGDPKIGPADQPRLILYSHGTDGTEWIWRQPRSAPETRRLLVAMANDEASSYACDGNAHWDRTSIQQWWASRENVLSWARDGLRTTADDSASYVQGGREATDHRALRALLGYYESDARDDLRRYAYFLCEGRLPGPGESLPAI